MYELKIMKYLNLKFIRRKKYYDYDVYNNVFEKDVNGKVLKKRDKAIIKRTKILNNIEKKSLKIRPIRVRSLEILNNIAPHLDRLFYDIKGDLWKGVVKKRKRKKYNDYLSFINNIIDDLEAMFKLYENNISINEKIAERNDHIERTQYEFVEGKKQFDDWYFDIHNRKFRMRYFANSTINEIAQIKKKKEFIIENHDDNDYGGWFPHMNITFVHFKTLKFQYLSKCVSKLIKILKKYKLNRSLKDRLSLYFFKILINFKQFLIYERKLKFRSRWLHRIILKWRLEHYWHNDILSTKKIELLKEERDKLERDELITQEIEYNLAKIRENY